MGLFRIEKKEKKQTAEEFAGQENIPVPQPPKPEPTDMILNNQQIIVQNQQIIVNEIGKLGKLIAELAAPAPEMPEEEDDEEISEEELAAAQEIIKKAAKKKK